MQTSRINYWNTLCFILSFVVFVHSSISKEQHKKYPCNPSSHNRKYGECACEMHTPKINYWKTHKPVCFLISYVLSVIQQYKQRTARKASLQSITENTENILVKWRTQHSKQGIAQEVPQQSLCLVKKIKPLCDMEECHGVEIGASYRNDHGCASFVDSVTSDPKEYLKQRIDNANFFFFDDRWQH